MMYYKNISVIGGGTMGNGIAHVFALKGFAVSLYDISDDALQKALATIQHNLDRQIKKEMITKEDKDQALARISVSSSWKEAVEQADMVVEAATEHKEVKLKLFQRLDQSCQEHTILATNTSSISITALAAATKRPGKVIGMHFMNPVPVMKLVEVIQGYATDAEVVEHIVNLSKQLDKIPYVVHDYPGFISNRILMPMINEAIYTLYEGVSGVNEIDQIMQLGMAHPMGPLKLADFIGLDVCLSIMRVLQEGFGNSKYAPCPLLINMVTAGKLGVKSGEGFYNYRDNKKEPQVAPTFLS